MLIDAIEGDDPRLLWYAVRKFEISDDDARAISRAVMGRLGSAKRFHDRHLPGLIVVLAYQPGRDCTVDVYCRCGPDGFGEDPAGNLARAWILATLRAMEARAAAQDGVGT
jgi:hypothetical protein